MIVVDASAFVTVLLRLEPAASGIRDRMSRPGESLHAPHLFDAEVVHALRRYALRRELSARRAEEALRDLADLRLIRYPFAPVLHRVWKLRRNLSAFDAAYVALAEALDAPLVTCDGRLAASPGHRVEIELYEPFARGRG